MDYRDEDRWLFNMKDESEHGLTWWQWLLLALAAIGISLQWGCDSEAAEVTAKIEKDAYERYADVQAVARYRLSDQPIKASTLEVTLTVCQQYSEINHRWQCFAIK